MIFERIKSDGLAHIKGSYSIWLEGLPAYAGWVLTYEKPILLVLECRDHLDKAVRYLVRLARLRQYSGIPEGMNRSLV